MLPKLIYLIKTKYGAFRVRIWYDKRDKIYLVSVLSFDDTMTQGSTLTEAKHMAEDLIELLCEVAFDEGKVIVDDEHKIAGRGKPARVTGPAIITAA